MKEPTSTCLNRAWPRGQDDPGVGHAPNERCYAAVGHVDDGTATTDYDEEEIARKMSIATGLAFVGGERPRSTAGYARIKMSVHEAKMVLPVVDAALVVVDGVAGVEVVTERVSAAAESAICRA